MEVWLSVKLTSGLFRTGADRIAEGLKLALFFEPECAHR